VTHSYVLVETSALVHRRLSASAVRDLFDAFIPAMTVMFVDAALQARAAAAHLAGLRRRVSFVDRVSFQQIRDMGLDEHSPSIATSRARALYSCRSEPIRSSACTPPSHGAHDFG